MISRSCPFRACCGQFRTPASRWRVWMNGSGGRRWGQGGSSGCISRTRAPRCGSTASSSISRTWCCTTPAKTSAPRPVNDNRPRRAARAGASPRSRRIGRYPRTVSARCGKPGRSDRVAGTRRRRPELLGGRSQPIRKGRGKLSTTSKMCPVSTSPSSMRHWRDRRLRSRTQPGLVAPAAVLRPAVPKKIR